MTKYAQNTTVSPEKSRAEIQRIIQRYGAEKFAYAEDSDQAMIVFQVHGRRVKFTLALPDVNDEEFTTTAAGYTTSDAANTRKWEQSTRQRWRALALCIKAKLESVQSEIVTFDEEFLAHIVLPSGETMGERYVPDLDRYITSGQLPPLLEW